MTNIKAVKTPMLMKSRVLRREDVGVDIVFPFMIVNSAVFRRVAIRRR